METKKISFVIPCYRSELTLGGVVEEIDSTMKTMQGYTHEIILIMTDLRIIPGEPSVT